MAGQIIESSLMAITEGPVPCPLCFDWANWEKCDECSGSGYVKGRRCLEILRDPRHSLLKTGRYFELLGDDDPITTALRPLLQKEVSPQ